MKNKRLARIVMIKEHFQCEMCQKSKLGKCFEYQNVSFVRGFIPHHYKKVCENCIYKTIYGTKNYKQKKKEGVLE